MVDAPQQDWSYFADRSRLSDREWLQSSAPDERFAMYADMFNVLWAARPDSPGNWQRLDNWHWDEKCALRRRMVEGYNQLDRLRREQSAANHAG